MKKRITKNLAAGIIVCLVLSSASFLLAESQTKDKKININTASLSELQKLPRIGATVAQRIIDFRKKHGKFKKIEEIMKVKGIGEKTFKMIKDLITVGSTPKAK